MIIVIDGYNLLRAVFYREKGKLTSQRLQLIAMLKIYREQKFHDIVIVFDGGHASHAVREVHGGVIVVYSGQNRSADDWIIEYIDRKISHEIMLVTRDRQIIDKTHRDTVDVLDVADFYQLLIQVVAHKNADQLSQTSQVGSIEKYEHECDDMFDDHDKKELDALMVEGALLANQKEMSDTSGSVKKKGSAKRRSKKEKRIEKKVRKL